MSPDNSDLFGFEIITNLTEEQKANAICINASTTVEEIMEKRGYTRIQAQMFLANSRSTSDRVSLDKDGNEIEVIE